MDTSQAVILRHVEVYRQSGRFAGWPANHGIWSWGDEILVGFSEGELKPGRGFHAIDEARPQRHLLARSMDGGETWAIEDPSKIGPWIRSHTRYPPYWDEPEWLDCPGGIPFDHPDFAMTCRMTGLRKDASRFYWSADRGRSWRGPYRLPLFGQKGVAARTCYLVDGPRECIVFLSSAKQDGKEGRPFCARTIDGGMTWQFVSWIGEEPPPRCYAIMPSAVRLDTGELLAAIRCRYRHQEAVTWIEHRYRRLYRGLLRTWIETHISEDNGATWDFHSIVVPKCGPGGSPPDLIRLTDNRLVLTYGCRYRPYGIHVMTSNNGGWSWGEPLSLRDDGGDRDIGYTRTVQRSDGALVTVYYYCDHKDGERYIAATIWALE